MSPIGKSLLRGLQGLQGHGTSERRLKRAVAAGQEHPERWRERLGLPSAPRPDGPLVWIHIHGVDEIDKVRSLYRHIQSDRDDLNMLVTTITYEDVPAMKRGITHQFAPLATTEATVRFLDHWQPDVLLWMDPDMNDALLQRNHQRHVPAFWLNAHVTSELKRARRWWLGPKRLPPSVFDRILAESDKSRRDLRRIGVPGDLIEVTGPLQTQVVPPSCNMQERDRMAAVLDARPVWLASRLHRAEEEMIISAHRQIVRKSHRLLLVVEPADPARGETLAKQLEEDGWNVALRSRDDDPSRDVQIYIADEMHESGLWMHLAPITFAGGSHQGARCLNPLKPAALGSVVLYGGNTDRHRQAFRRLASVGAARRAEDVDKLAFEVERLLSPDRAAQMAMAAWDVTTSGAEVSDLVRDYVLGALDGKGI